MDIQRSEIEKMEMLLIEGIKKSDINFLDKTIHDDLLCMGPDGRTITKAMDLASHKAGEMIVEELTPTIEDIRIIGDTAVSTIVYDTKGSMLGNPIEGKFKYIRVWKMFDDGLKVIAASCFKLS
ncbi:nuclear transport factor 2 family protein [Pontibacter vulgaris]|uniref:nuclear transport factor 2 family protein n=1 Tax=Pontibacter vulgaris TaxID=2905679 RepID=UPI001FA7C343|nr:nuclear transport factor 2 family protein [Pontibacter vulgaris]